MNQTNKGDNKRTKQEKILICNHCNPPPFFRLEGYPSEYGGQPPLALWFPTL